MLIYAFITGIVALLGSVLLLGLGLRGRRVNDHVVCGKCRFDLEGVYPGVGVVGGVRCPECGRELVGDRCVKRGVRERSRRMLVGAGVCFAVFIGAGALVANQARQQGFNVYQHTPVWLLVLEGEGPWPTVANAALSELVDRQTNGELGGEREAAVIRRALAYQGDVDRVWRTGWGLLIENAIVGGRLSEADTKRYARQAVVVRVAARERVRLGDPLPAVLRTERRMAANSILWFAIFNDGAMFGDEMLGGAIDWIYRESGAGGIGSAFVSDPVVDKMELRLSPEVHPVGGHIGLRDLATRWVVVVGLDTAAGHASGVHGFVGYSGSGNWREGIETREWSDETDWASNEVDDAKIARLLAAQGDFARLRLRQALGNLSHRVAAWRVEEHVAVAVVEEHAETVRLIHSDARIREVESVLRTLPPVRVTTSMWSSGQEIGLWGEYSRPFSIPIAFDVLVRDGDLEYSIGTISVDAGGEWPVSFHRGLYIRIIRPGAPVPDGFQAQTVDLIFRPNPDAARLTVGIDRIVGREFVFEQVPVQWPAGGVPGQPSP